MWRENDGLINEKIKSNITSNGAEWEDEPADCLEKRFVQENSKGPTGWRTVYL